MKGWRPSTLKGSKPVRALFRADVFLPDIGSIALSFPPLLGPRVHDPGCSVVARVPRFARNEARGRQVGRKRRKKKKMAWGRCNHLIRLDSAKEIQGFEFGFRSAGFGICCARLGFRCGRLAFPCVGFGNPTHGDPRSAVAAASGRHGQASEEDAISNGRSAQAKRSALKIRPSASRSDTRLLPLPTTRRLLPIAGRRR
jgi:hypothetical protein